MKKIVSVKSNSMYLTDELPVFINRVSESFELEQHRHEFIEFNYVSEGRGYHYVEGSVIPVVKGDLFYLPVGISHVFRPSTPEPTWGRLIIYNCLFSQAFASHLLKSFALGDEIRNLLENSYPEQSWVHLHDIEGSFQHYFNVMFEEFQLRKSNYLPLLQAEIVKLLVHMSRMQETDGVERIREMESVIDQIVKRIQQQSAEPYSVKQLADELRMSERHFRRLFKERCGMTYMEYIHKCRIELSCHLLRQTTNPIGMIAQLAGYRDLKFYNKLFKKITGMTPRAYRIHAGFQMKVINENIL